MASKLKSLWAGEVPLPETFWWYAVAYGVLANIVTSQLPRGKPVAAGAHGRHIWAMNDLILHPSVVRDQAEAERIVTDGFWDKVRRTLGKVPFVEDAVAAYFCAVDPRSPAAVKAGLLGALAYFVMPVDLVPDFIAGLGYTDDAAVLYGVIRLAHGHIKARHTARAAELLLAEPRRDETDEA
jgi:uncharacterized membrane protein YkvA (DUF1232 family)